MKYNKIVTIGRNGGKPLSEVAQYRLVRKINWLSARF